MFRLVRIVVALATALGAAPVMAGSFSFCWVGANGFSMSGTMKIPDDKLRYSVITQDDVTAFAISGYHEGTLVGRWDMRMLEPDDTWHLRFDPDSLVFPTGGGFRGEHGQGWNANGAVSDCGTPGFGFNSGNHAQDICIDGAFVAASSVPPDTPLRARPGLSDAGCGADLPLSKDGNGRPGD